MKHLLALIALQWTFVLAGCQSYVTPGDRADFAALGVSATQQDQHTPTDIAMLMDRKPLASFPAAIAVARVQGPHYGNYRVTSYGRGRYSVVTTRDIETDADFARIAALPMVRGLGMMNRLILAERLETDNQLRQAAARLKADLLLFYTLDTGFYVSGKANPLDAITLGFLPYKEARVVCTASAALMDTRSGYIYGLAEATATHQQAANAWTSRDAVDESRRRAEREAFEKLLGEIETMWAGVVQTYARPTVSSPQASRSR